MKKMAYANASFLWSFERADLDLPDDATDEELEEAATQYVENMLEEICHATGWYHNDLEVTLN